MVSTRRRKTDSQASNRSDGVTKQPRSTTKSSGPSQKLTTQKNLKPMDNKKSNKSSGPVKRGRNAPLRQKQAHDEELLHDNAMMDDSDEQIIDTGASRTGRRHDSLNTNEPDNDSSDASEHSELEDDEVPYDSNEEIFSSDDESEDEENEEAFDSDNDSLLNPSSDDEPTESEPIVARGHHGEGYTQQQLDAHVDDLSSDDEAVANTTGGVPREWYEEYDHIGYDVEGKRLVKKDRGDKIEHFIASQDDPNFRWTVYDSENDEEIVLTKKDVQMIRRMQSGNFPHSTFEPYPEYIDYNTGEKEIHPLSNAPEPKRRFVPSKWEMMKVNKIVKLIKEGKWKKQTAPETPDIYLMWGEDDQAIDFDRRKKAPPHIPAPKVRPPNHAASYNPPPEYLFTEEERAMWEDTAKERRPINFIPQKFSALRHVPLYQPLLRERFERCLDLYLCPRAERKKLSVTPDQLLPKLPDPSELRPFPTKASISFDGHEGRVRSVTTSPDGQWIVSGGDDKTVRMWELETGRQIHVWKMENVVHQVSWNPNPNCHVVAIACGKQILLLNTGTARSPEHLEATFNLLVGYRTEDAEARITTLASSAPSVANGNGTATADQTRTAESDSDVGSDSASDDEDNTKSNSDELDGKRRLAEWQDLHLNTPAQLRGLQNAGIRVKISIHAYIRRISWHKKGDYLASIAPQAQTGAVIIHQVSRRMSQNPFGKNKGQIQHAIFHPSKPIFYVATQRNIRVYHLLEQKMVQKLESSAKWISTIDIHPSGDHVVAGSYDRRVVWFDTELSSKPYKTLKFNQQAVRSTSFHKSYPLMASASDDGSVHIFHTKVFDDFVQNPLIVPVKILRAHKVTKDDLGCLDVSWHPNQPWIITSGADHSIILHQNIP